MAHDVAVVVLVKVLDGQALHSAEQLLPELFQRSLGDNGHELVEGQGGRQGQAVEGGQQGHQGEDLGTHHAPVPVLPVLLHQSDDVLHEDGGDGADNRVKEDAGHCHRQQHGIELPDGAQNTANGSDLCLIIPHRCRPLCFESSRLPDRWRCSAGAPDGCPRR